MIYSLLRNALVALLLHAGVTFAFDGEDAKAAGASMPPPAACLVPVQLSVDTNAPLNHSDNIRTHS